MRKTRCAVAGISCLLAGVFAAAQQPLKIQEEVTVRWWLVPVYAVDKAGAPVLDLAPEDLEIRIKNIKVDEFSLIKKRFQTGEENPAAAAPPARPPLQKKMVFLIFDATFSPYNLLSKAKAIADTVIAQSDKTAQYVLLSIEPFAGLNYIIGPTRNLNQLARSLNKYIAGKKLDYLLVANPMDNNEIRNAYPGGETRNPSSGRSRTGISAKGGQRSYTYSGGLGDWDLNNRIDWRDKKRVAAAYMSSLVTLDLVLGQFREYSKVIYLYSCGIPDDALLDSTEFPTLGVNGVTEWNVSLSSDSIAYDTLTMVGRHLNKTGAILFLVNPSGTRIEENASSSGEPSLRILAAESGGRYFEGEEREISQQVNSMEGGYYEVSFPDRPEYEGEELDFEIRAKRPEIQIFTVRKVGREKRYADMTEFEKEMVVLNILNKGPFAETSQNVSFVAAEDTLLDGDRLICQMPLPPELTGSEWRIFKIARNFKTGAVFVEKDTALPSIPSIQTRMKWRGDEFRHDIVLAHTKTGTILVWK